MTPILYDHIFIANSLHTAQLDFLLYEDFYAYKRILCKAVKKKYKDIVIMESDETIIEINHHTLVKSINGVYAFTPLDDRFINEINSIYSDDIKKMINSSNSKFLKVREKLKKERNKKADDFKKPKQKRVLAS